MRALFTGCKELCRCMQRGMVAWKVAKLIRVLALLQVLGWGHIKISRQFDWQFCAACHRTELSHAICSLLSRFSKLSFTLYYLHLIEPDYWL